MHWEYFAKNKGKAEGYKKENRAKNSQVMLNIKKWKVLMVNFVHYNTNQICKAQEM